MWFVPAEQTQMAGTSPAIAADQCWIVLLFGGGALGIGVRRDDVVHRRLHAALLVRNAGERQRHLGDAERAKDRAVIDVAEVADAEILARIGTEACAIGEIEGVEPKRAEL